MSDAGIFDALEARLEELSRSIRRGGDKKVFEKIFDVNNEIGRALRDHPSMKRALLDLQLSVNEITIGLKRGDTSRALASLETSLLFFSKMNEGRAAQKKNL